MLNAMAKTYSKSPKTDSIMLTIEALFVNSHPNKENNEEQSICDNLLILLRRLANGHRFKKKHFELIYHNVNQNGILKEDNDEDDKIKASTYAFETISITLEIISTLLSNDMMFKGPQNFIYFNGWNPQDNQVAYSSGIKTFKNGIANKSPFKSVSFLTKL